MKTYQNEQLITVITLSYYSDHLAETVDSVLSQKYPAIQYIIADDGTEDFDPDRWHQYIDTTQRGNIKEVLILHQNMNIGTVRNYNNALGYAKGEFIFPLAADDVYENPGVLDKWVEGFMQCGDPVVCTSCSVYDETLKHFRGKWPRPDHIRLLRSREWKEIYRAMETQKLLPGCTMARTKESLTSLGMFDTDYDLLEDYPFLMKALRKGVSVGFIYQSMVKKRSGGVSDGKSTNPRLEADMKLFYEKEIYPYCTNPEAIRKQIEEDTQKRKDTSSMFEIWEKGSASEKWNLFKKQPGFILRRVIRSVFRV